MKRLLINAASACLLLHAGIAAGQGRIEAIVIPEQGNPQRIWINDVGRTQIQYFATDTTTTTSVMSIAETKSVFFPEPAALADAIGQFRAREYRAAIPAFAKVAADYRSVRTLVGNPSTRAAFFEMECLRKLGEYDKLAEKLASINKSSLARENELRQLELNLMWQAVGQKAWNRLKYLVNERADTHMPGGQLAQVVYCKALLHEQNEELDEALLAYNEAMIVDAAASEVVARMAALAILRIIDADPAVHTARKAWGTQDEMKNSAGHARLLEAGAVARIYEDFVGAGSPLPDRFKDYIKYEATDPES